jgi:hypothetical protein
MSNKQTPQQQLLKIAGALFITAGIVGSLSEYLLYFIGLLPLGVVFLVLGINKKT